MRKSYSCRMDTECCVCFEPYERVGGKCPKLLPCVHTFCVQCLTRLINNGKMRCPECRPWHPLSQADVQNLPVNSRILEYLNYSVHRPDKAHKDTNNNADSFRPFSFVDICELHGQPCVMVRYDIDGPKQKLCEICLDPQTFSNSSSRDSTERESVISENPRRIQFICTAHVGDFTRETLGTTPRDQERGVRNDVTGNTQEVETSGAGNLIQHQQHCSTKIIVGTTLCLCIPLSVIFLLLLIPALHENW